jgi:hypothetical protein
MEPCFIYVVGLGKTGTKKLAEAFQAVGVHAGHEIVRVGDLHRQYCNSWLLNQQDREGQAIVHDVAGRISSFISSGPGMFHADISHYLSCLYPVIESLPFATRSVMLSNDALGWVAGQTRMYGSYVGDPQGGLSYWLHGLPSSLHSASVFEVFCHAWAIRTRHFLESGMPIFPIMARNEQAELLLDTLYPECPGDKREKFIQTIVEPRETAGRFYRNIDWRQGEIEHVPHKLSQKEWRLLDEICGPVQEELDKRKQAL